MECIEGAPSSWYYIGQSEEGNKLVCSYRGSAFFFVSQYVQSLTYNKNEKLVEGAEQEKSLAMNDVSGYKSPMVSTVPLKNLKSSFWATRQGIMYNVQVLDIS